MKQQILIKSSGVIMTTVFVILTFLVFGYNPANAGGGTAPDLAVTSIEVYKSLSFDQFPLVGLTYQVDAGDSILARANINNVGTAASDDMTVKVYVMNSLSNEDRLVASQNYSIINGTGGSLPPGSSIDYKY